jgi:hypothetical protein
MVPWQLAVDLDNATYDALTAVAGQRGVRVETVAREVLTQWAARKPR